MAQGADLNVPRSILSDGSAGADGNHVADGSAGADRRTADDRDIIADHEDPDGPADAIVRASGGRIVAETSLYAPVKAFLEAQGFDVKGEVCGCDIVGVRPGEPPLVVVTELKLSFNLELVLQAVDRLSACDAVYLAVVATRRGRDQDRRVHRPCRLLGLGLLAVDLRLGTVQMTGSRTTTHRSRVPPARAGRARYGPRPNCFDANVQIIRDASGPSWSLNGASAAPPLHAWPSRSTRTSVATVWRPRSNAVTVAP